MTTTNTTTNTAAPVSAAEVKRLKGLGCLQNKGTNLFNVRVITGNGNISAAEHRAVANAAEKYGNGRISMTTRLTLEIMSVPYESIDALRAELAEAGLETGGTGPKVRPIVACKGTTCQYGLLDSLDLSEKIHERFYKGYRDVTLPHKFKIAVGGCPNNCVKPDLNDLGIVGQLVPVLNPEKCKSCKVCQVEAVCPMKAAVVEDGKPVINEETCIHCGRCARKCPFHAVEEKARGFRVYIGGRWGKKSAHGIPLSKIFTSEEELMDVIDKAICYFRDNGIAGERFADTIARIGFENVEKALLDQ